MKRGLLKLRNVAIKPITVNHAWRGGRRFRTEYYKAFEQELLLRLPPISIPDGELSVFYEFGVSNKGFDYDNAIKPFQDVLQKKYEFNDARIVEAVIRKRLVKKGDEYIRFEIVGACNEL